jgi:hypothetical protein
MVKKLLILLFVGSLGYFPPSLAQSEVDVLRIEALSNILPMMMYFEKSINPNKSQNYRLVILNDTPNLRAPQLIKDTLVAKLATIPHPLYYDIRTLPFDQLFPLPERDLVVMLSHRLDPISLQALIRQAKEKHWALFSPFTGDVEQGVSFGIQIGRNVSPYINLDSIWASGLALEATLFPVVKIYPPSPNLPQRLVPPSAPR